MPNGGIITLLPRGSNVAKEVRGVGVTQKDIANRLGVSRRLVGYALNNQDGVGDEMRQRIYDIANELGYKPNRAAKTLNTGRTYQIALCLPTLSLPFHAQFIHHFEELSRDTEYDLVVSTLTKSTSISKVYADGYIIHESGDIGEITHPTVLLQSPPFYAKAHGQPYDQIFLDMTDAARQAILHLLEINKSRIAYVAYDALQTMKDPRYNAYYTEVQRRGLMPEVIGFEIGSHDQQRTVSQRALKKYFCENGFPDALFCCNDEIAIGAYRALRELKRQVPNETAVIGCDDIPETIELYPSLTTITNNWRDVCNQAWQLLLSRIECPELAPRAPRSKAELLIRESSVIG